MKRKIIEKIEIPNGISSIYKDKHLICEKDSNKISKELNAPAIEIKVDRNQIIISCEKGNKKHYKIVKSFVAHIKNIFQGLNEKHVYELEVCYVHFPITLKVEQNKLLISNFFGEKKPRIAEILPKVDIEIKGKRIVISSPNKDAAGETAANFERATKLRGRDRRIYQDGIFIVEKPRRHTK